MNLNQQNIKFEVFDKFGNLEFHKEQLMKSLVSNWASLQRGVFAHAAASLKDTGGSGRSHTMGSSFRVDAGETIITHGIRVGTSNQGVGIGDFVLIGPIGHGNGGGQLYHKVTVVSAVTTAGGSLYFTVQRNFDNNSGGSITVEEVCLIAFNSTNTWYFLFARDLTGSVEVGNGKTFIATYTYTVSV